MDYTALLASTANGVAQMAGQSIAAAANKDIQKMVNEANFEMAEWQNATNVQNWQMQNYYNSPSMQMQRLKDAGLNPNLVYGNGAVGNSASAPASVSAPRMEGYQYPTNMFDGLGRILDGLLASASIKKTDAEIASIRETTNLTAQNAANARVDRAIKELSLARTETEREYWKGQIETALRLQNVMADNYVSQKDYRDNYETKVADSQIGLNNQRMVSEILSQELQPYRKQHLQAQITSLFTSAEVQRELAASNIYLNQSRVEEIAARIANMGADTTGKEIQNEIKELLLHNGIRLEGGSTWEFLDRISYRVENFIKHLFD